MPNVECRLTAGSVTARFHDKALVVGVDSVTEVIRVGPAGTNVEGRGPSAIARIKAGEPIELHYRDAHHVRTARYVWVGVPVDAKTESKRPSTSAAGIVAAVKPRKWIFAPRIVVASGSDRRSFQVPAKAGEGAAPQVNDRVVITYRKHRSTLTVRVLRTIPAQ